MIMKKQKLELKVLVNGQCYIINAFLQIDEVLEFLNSKNRDFIIEYNHTIKSFEEYKNISIKNYDNIEIITIVGGG